VNQGEWDRACDDPSRGRVSEKGVGIRRELLERLLDARWAERTPDGFTFLHPMLRESLERVARKAGRWAGHHQAVATMLEVSDVADPARIGQHLLEAGRATEAVDLLIKGYDATVLRSGLDRGSYVLVPLERAMNEARLPETDVRWAGLWRRQASQLRARRLHADALAHAQHARQFAERLDDDVEWARCGHEIATILEAQGELPEALTVLQKSVTRLLRRGQKGVDLVQLLLRMTSIARLMNRLDDAERWAEQAIGVLEKGKIEDPGRLGYLENELAIVAARRREFSKAVQLFDSAQGRLAPGGPSRRLSEVLNNRGDCLKNLGRWADAEKAFLEAVAMSRAVGMDTTVPSLNLVICQIHVGRYEAARDAATEIERVASGVFVPVAILARTVCQAALGRTEAVDRDLGPAAERMRKAKYVDPDLVWLAEHGAEACRRRSAKDQAVAFLYFAREQMAALGDEAGMARVSRVLDQLG
jgi:tetratricopeptide (TPR) repeat protein